MCYAFTPVLNPQGGLVWLPKTTLDKFSRLGLILQRPDGFYYARDDVKVFYWIEDHVDTDWMRFDLVPPFFMQKENLSKGEMIKRKESQAKGSKGFNSWNAKMETIESLPSFREAWRLGQRMVVPVSKFKERPNMENAPPEFRGKEYEIQLPTGHYLAGIWSDWKNGNGEDLKSFAISTVSSSGNEKLRGIWHERCPVILEEAQVQEWLDPQTSPAKAKEMCVLFSAHNMTINEVVKSKPSSNLDSEQVSLF
jgi:putative SOS response-associated peptidase YedK